jgi:hypothetical protein
MRSKKRGGGVKKGARAQTIGRNGQKNGLNCEGQTRISQF